MKEKTSLLCVWWLSLAGTLFSAFLSWNELSTGICILGGCTSIANIPACVYGCVMFMAILLISSLGLQQKQAAKPARRARAKRKRRK